MGLARAKTSVQRCKLQIEAGTNGRPKRAVPAADQLHEPEHAHGRIDSSNVVDRSVAGVSAGVSGAVALPRDSSQAAQVEGQTGPQAQLSTDSEPATNYCCILYASERSPPDEGARGVASREIMVLLRSRAREGVQIDQGETYRGASS